MAERLTIKTQAGEYGLEIEGRKELVAALRAADANLPKRVRTANKTAAEVVAEKARPNVPRGPTGNLAKSVKTLASQRYAAVKAGTPSRVPYAPPIHWGWPARNIPENKYLWNAKDEAFRDGSLERAYTDEMEALLRLVNSRGRVF